MVVVVIIAVIAGALLFNYSHAKSEATVSVTETNMKSIATAVESFEADTGSYPATGTVNAALFGANAAKYLPGTPTSPGSGNGAYTYTLSQDGTQYTIVDPSSYDPVSLGSLPQGAAPAAGVEAATAGKCVTAGTCTHVGYSSTEGIFGY
jgi:general secretion pathway protein G